MPFPPTFTNVYDITQPPDTQLANLLGQDIRNLKTDIMQRMSLLSGTLANRPTPETLNAVWGGSGFGLIYLATDTNQIFQWNNTSWVQLTGFGVPPRYSDVSINTYVNPAAGTFSGNSILVPANTLQIGSQIKILARGSSNAPSGAAFRLNIGSTISNAISFSSSGADFEIVQGDLVITGASASIGTLVFSSQDAVSGPSIVRISGTDTYTSGITISTQLTSIGGTVTFILDYLSVVVFP